MVSKPPFRGIYIRKATWTNVIRKEDYVEDILYKFI